MKTQHSATKPVFRILLTAMMVILALSITVSAAAIKKTVKMKKGTKTVSYTVTAGDTISLTIKNNGKKVPLAKAKVKSSRSSVASVSKKGVITAKKAGNAVITIKYAKKVVKVKVTVKAKPKNSSSGPKKIPPSDKPTKKGEYVDGVYVEGDTPPGVENALLKMPNVEKADLKPNFDPTQPVKFNTLYLIKGRQMVIKDTLCVDFGTIYRAGLVLGNNYSGTFAWSQMESAEGLHGSSNGSTWNGSKELDLQYGEAINKLYNAGLDGTDEWINRITGGRKLRWIFNKRTVTACYWFGALDPGDEFWFYITPTTTKGRCVESFRFCSNRIAQDPSLYTLYNLKLDDVCEKTVFDQAAELP